MKTENWDSIDRALKWAEEMSDTAPITAESLRLLGFTEDAGRLRCGEVCAYRGSYHEANEWFILKANHDRMPYRPMPRTLGDVRFLLHRLNRVPPDREVVTQQHGDGE